MKMCELELVWCANNKIQLTAHVATALVVQNNIEFRDARKSVNRIEIEIEIESENIYVGEEKNKNVAVKILI